MSAGIAAHEMRLARQCLRSAITHLRNAQAQSHCLSVDRADVVALIDGLDAQLPSTHVLESRFRLWRVTCKADEVMR